MPGKILKAMGPGALGRIGRSGAMRRGMIGLGAPAFKRANRFPIMPGLAGGRNISSAMGRSAAYTRGVGRAKRGAMGVGALGAWQYGMGRLDSRNGTSARRGVPQGHSTGGYM